MTPTVTTKPPPSLFAAYPPTRGDPRICYTSIRNTPQAIEAYVREVGAPELVASIEHVTPALRERAWAAGYLLVNGRVTLHAEPRKTGYSLARNAYRYELATVRGRVHEHVVAAYDTSPTCDASHTQQALCCSCGDTAAPGTRIADHTCTHIISYLLQEGA